MDLLSDVGSTSTLPSPSSFDEQDEVDETGLVALPDEIPLDDGAAGAPAARPAVALQEQLAQVANKRLRDALAKRLSKQDKRSSMLMQEYQQRDELVGTQWNRRRLRQGDTMAGMQDSMSRRVKRKLIAAQRYGVSVPPGWQGAALAPPRPGSNHPNRWTWEGTLKHAFSCIGHSVTRLTRESHNEIAAISMTVLAHLHNVEEHLREFFMTFDVMPETDLPRWLIIDRAWDMTPLHVSFGACADIARPVAWYWWKDFSVPAGSSKSQGTWRQLTLKNIAAGTLAAPERTAFSSAWRRPCGCHGQIVVAVQFARRS